MTLASLLPERRVLLSAFPPGEVRCVHQGFRITCGCDRSGVLGCRIVATGSCSTGAKVSQRPDARACSSSG